MKAQDLLCGIPADLSEELCTIILQANNLRVERIVSQGHASPLGFWYDQEEDEWIIVLEGSATLQFDGEAEPVKLRRGSYLNIPAHTRHRIAWTDPNQKPFG